MGAYQISQLPRFYKNRKAVTEAVTASVGESVGCHEVGQGCD